MQTAFHKIRALMVGDDLAAYPDLNTWFNAYTDASDYQLGVCIVQKGHPVAFFSHMQSSHSKITL